MHLLFLLLVCTEAWAWEQHFLITLTALDDLPSAQKTAVYEPFESSMKISAAEFSTQNKIQKNWKFPNRLGEKSGSKHSLIAVISTYSDEPDWGLDQNLFEPDQYPELWTPTTKYCSGKTGLKSQAFRHVYFPGAFSWWHPIATFQIPMEPLGEAPDRAGLYYKIAKNLFAQKKMYWGARFLGWSLHYLHDLYNPYHSSQTPSKRMIRTQWKGFFPGLDFDGTAEQLGYYHFSYETWARQQMHEPNSALLAALKSKDVNQTSDDLAGWIRREVIPYSSKGAPQVASACLKAFAAWEPKDGQQSEHYVGTKEWEAGFNASALESVQTLTTELFQEMGKSTRAIVRQGLQ